MPPDGVAGLDVRDAAEGAHEQRVPLLDRGEHLVDGGAAHVVLGHVGEQRAQHQVGHRLGDRHGVEHALVAGHVRQRGPALEGAEHRAHRRAGVLRAGGAVRGVPRVVLLDGAVEQVAEGLLVGARHPQVERAGVEVGAEAAGVRAGRAAADAVGVERVPVGVEPLHAVGLVGPLVVEERLDPRHAVALARLHLRRSTSRRGRSRAREPTLPKKSSAGPAVVRRRSRCARRSRRCPGPRRAPGRARSGRGRRRSRGGAGARPPPARPCRPRCRRSR